MRRIENKINETEIPLRDQSIRMLMDLAIMQKRADYVCNKLADIFSNSQYSRMFQNVLIDIIKGK